MWLVLLVRLSPSTCRRVWWYCYGAVTGEVAMVAMSPSQCWHLPANTANNTPQHSTTPHQPDAAPPATLQPSQPPPRLTWETLGWGHFAPNFGTEFTSMKKYRYFWGVAARHSMFTPAEPPVPMIELGAGGGCDRLTQQFPSCFPPFYVVWNLEKQIKTTCENLHRK